MKLYHGSNTAIARIDLARCKPYKDFGQGFYLTEIEEQAVQMARRTAAIYGGEPVVTAFGFDEAAAIADGALSVKRFAEPDQEWALFVMANRSREGAHPVHDYDIVIGSSVISKTGSSTCRCWLLDCATKRFPRNIFSTRHAPSNTSKYYER